jgi:CheY-like chemotaxis protein
LIQEIGKVLVVDGSLVMRELLRVLLSTQCQGVRTAGTRGEAREELRWHGDLDLVLCDAHLPDGDGLSLLEEEKDTTTTRRWIVMTARPDPGSADRARKLGALGYLTKPVAFRDIAGALRGCGHGGGGRVAPRRRFSVDASIMDPLCEGDALLEVDVLDLSESGAFLATPGPLALGTRLQLALPLPDDLVLVTASVVRVQEPVWGGCGGVGVRFENLDPLSLLFLRRYLERSSSEGD